MKIGFIGKGHITSAIVEGLCTGDNPPDNIIVSPRNTEKAEKLAERFLPRTFEGKKSGTVWFRSFVRAL